MKWKCWLFAIFVVGDRVANACKECMVGLIAKNLKRIGTPCWNLSLWYDVQNWVVIVTELTINRAMKKIRILITSNKSYLYSFLSLFPQIILSCFIHLYWSTEIFIRERGPNYIHLFWCETQICFKVLKKNYRRYSIQTRFLIYVQRVRNPSIKIGAANFLNNSRKSYFPSTKSIHSISFIRSR